MKTSRDIKHFFNNNTKYGKKVAVISGITGQDGSFGRVPDRRIRGWYPEAVLL